MIFKFWDKKTNSYIKTNEILRLSATDIGVGRKCHFQLAFKLQGYKTSKNHYLAMGSCMHSAIEMCLIDKAKEGKVKKWQAVEKDFEVFWQKEAKDTVFNKISEEKAKYTCLGMIKAYYAQALPLLYPLAAARYRPKDSIERFFIYPDQDKKTKEEQYLTYNGMRLKFSGKIDLISRDYFVVDHKSTGDLANWDQGKADNEIQPYLYIWAMKNSGLDIKGFSYYITDGKTVKRLDVKYDENKVAGILKEAFQLKESIESGNLMRAKSARDCSWCEFKDICPEKIG